MSLLEAIQILTKRGVKLEVTGSYHRIGRMYKADFFWVDAAALISMAEDRKG